MSADNSGTTATAVSGNVASRRVRPGARKTTATPASWQQQQQHANEQLQQQLRRLYALAHQDAMLAQHLLLQQQVEQCNDGMEHNADTNNDAASLTPTAAAVGHSSDTCTRHPSWPQQSADFVQLWREVVVMSNNNSNSDGGDDDAGDDGAASMCGCSATRHADLAAAARSATATHARLRYLLHSHAAACAALRASRLTRHELCILAAHKDACAGDAVLSVDMYSIL